MEQVTINVDEGNRQLEKGVMYKVRERETETTLVVFFFSAEMFSASPMHNCHHHFGDHGCDYHCSCHCWLHSKQEVLATCSSHLFY